MALIKCPECGREISDRASTCPGCGCPVEKPEPANNSHAFFVRSIDKDFVYLECRGCSKPYKYRRDSFSDVSFDKCVSIGRLRCHNCGATSPENATLFAAKDDTYVHRPPPVRQTQTEPRCPKCGSTQIQAMKQGFGLGKAAVGGLLLGPVGLLGGAVGSNKIRRICLNCKHKF